MLSSVISSCQLETNNREKILLLKIKQKYIYITISEEQFHMK